MRDLIVAIVGVVVASSVQAESDVQHDATAVYALPFKSGSYVCVVLGYDYPRHHTGRSASRSTSECPSARKCLLRAMES